MEMLILPLYVHGFENKAFYDVWCEDSKEDGGDEHAHDADHTFFHTLRADVALSHCGCSLDLELPRLHLDQLALVRQNVVLEEDLPQVVTVFRIEFIDQIEMTAFGRD